ncbi:hypothetical protein Csa_007736 [Cucumis sativus]|uniref:DUF7745 domain-containing protein n=1 Tax=Cucumis sativus TaxID=3659 RepID=A0A0A0KP72_CUCSA|nr:hypothetical protein Csa_007736 [Cucumis sativus]
MKEIVWRSLWVPKSPLTYRCGQLLFISLLGLWGGIAYSPLLVLHQTWSKQFASVIYGLEDWDFSYEADEMIVKVQEVIETWKVVRRLKSLRHCKGTTNQYDIWRADRNGFEFATIPQY